MKESYNFMLSCHQKARAQALSTDLKQSRAKLLQDQIQCYLEDIMLSNLSDLSMSNAGKESLSIYLRLTGEGVGRRSIKP